MEDDRFLTVNNCYDGPPPKPRNRSASLAWADLLTTNSYNDTPQASESETDDEDAMIFTIKEDAETTEDNNILSTLSQKKKRIDDQIFDTYCDESDKMLAGKLLAMLESNGLQRSDYRLKELFSNLKRILKEREAIHRGRLNGDFVGSIETLQLTREEFRELALPNVFIILTAFRNHFVIPKFDMFCQMIEDIYNDCKEITGKGASNLCKLQCQDGLDAWAVACCTVDGQRFSIGDANSRVTLHALSKPIMYAHALQELGKEKVHEYVGQEPSGHIFNELVLDHKKRPHNPMINAGGIMVHAILQKFHRPELSSSQRFNEIRRLFEKICGGEYVGFNNGMFLNKREASDRNWALAYFMRENGCFPPDTDLADCIEYYLQTSSMESTVEAISVVAATLANGGICPTTGERVLSDEVVADVLSILFSCGMLEFSGKFAFRVGLPAKSAIMGTVLLVVPNVGGFAMWSPALDEFQNSARGVAFCEKLVETFNFHCFDVDKYNDTKIDPTRRTMETRGSNTIVLKYSAAAGDIDSIFRLHLCGVDMGLFDCDGRTALHVAACEGHYDVCEYLLRQCGVRHDRKDRWGNTPYDEAIQFGHVAIAELIRNWHPEKRRYSSSRVGGNRISRLRRTSSTQSQPSFDEEESAEVEFENKS